MKVYRIIIFLIVLSLNSFAQKNRNWVEYRCKNPNNYLVLYSDSTFSFSDSDFTKSEHEYSFGIWSINRDTLSVKSYDLTRLAEMGNQNQIMITYNKRFKKIGSTLTQLDNENLIYNKTRSYDSVEFNKKVERDSRYTHKLFVISPELSYQGTLLTGLFILYGKEESNAGGVGSGFWGPRIGYETSFTKNRISIYHVGYNADAVPFCLRISALGVVRGNESDYRIAPEIGISLLYFNLTYSYNIHLFGDKISDISKSKVSLTFNILKGIYKRKKKN